MALKSQCLALFMTLMLFLVIKIEGDSITKEANKDVEIISPSSPPPLAQPNAVVNQIRPIQCGTTQSCGQGILPPREMCCNNQCVDITSDRDNCGFCGIRCILNSQCCNRVCTPINFNPFNCGGCGNMCPICIFGTCLGGPTTPAVPLTPPPPLVVIPSPPLPPLVVIPSPPPPPLVVIPSPPPPPLVEIPSPPTPPLVVIPSPPPPPLVIPSPPLVANPSPPVLPSPQFAPVENASKPEPHQAESPTQPPIMD